MDVVIRKTGNSKGVILPANVLKETGIDKIAEMRVEKDCITLKAIRPPRSGWLDAIRQDPPQDNGPVFMDGVDDPELMDGWTW